MSKQSLIIYSTDACHLCELAIEVINQSQFTGEIAVRDIITQSRWMDSYQLRIPVIQYANQELDWPFSVAEVNQFLQNCQRESN